MRSRKTSQDQFAEVARRRLELLSAELADNRPEQSAAPTETARRPEGLTDPSVERPRAALPEGRDWPGERAAVPSGVEGAAAGQHAQRSVGITGRMSGWVGDRQPPTLQGGASLSLAHLAVVAAALVAGVLATVWWVATSDSEGGSALPVAAPASPLVTVPSLSASASVGYDGASGPTDASASASAAAAPAPGRSASSVGPTAPASGSVVVDVAGKVRRPGIATLPLGARVVDALEAAGGARRGVRLSSLNLARVLTDGEQIVVGVPAPPGVAASAASAPTGTTDASNGSGGAGVPMVNINTAGQTELEELPGIGPVTAQAILAFRSERGTFSSVDELLEVSGIGDATLADMAPYVTL